MRLSQADYRSVRIEAGALQLLLRYSMYQDDEERLPESIICEGNTVVAYFLAATIRDVIDRTPHGFCVQRHWKILREGRFALAFTLDLPRAGSPAFLFPGAAAGSRPPVAQLCVAETRSGYPNGLYLFTRPEGLFVFSDPEPHPPEQGSVGLREHRMQADEPPAVRLELRYPDATRSSAAKPHRARVLRSRGLRHHGLPELPCLVSPGSLERAHRLNVVHAPAPELRQRATAAVLDRLPAPAPRLPEAAQLRSLLDREVQACLQERLLEREGVCGLRREPGGDMLCIPAGCGLALLLLRLYPADPGKRETALRLADFALRAQHPAGPFYETFDCLTGAWSDSGPPVADTAGPRVAAEASALSALRLAQLAGVLSQGRSAAEGGARYLHAARLLGDALIAAAPPVPQIGEHLEVGGLLSAPQSLGGLAFLELYGELHALTGKDRYRKAWSGLRARVVQMGGGTAEGFAPADARAALLRARLAALAALPAPGFSAARRSPGAGVRAPATASGPTLKIARSCFSELLPWIYLNAPAGRRTLAGALIPALGAEQVTLRGFQTAWLLLTLNRLLGKKRPLPALRQLIAQLIACSAQGPIGASFALSEPAPPAPTGSPRPPSAGGLVDELLHLHGLLSDFPALFRGAVRPT